MKNCLIHRKKRYFEGGGNTYNPVTNTYSFKQFDTNWKPDAVSTNTNAKYGLNSDFSAMNKEQSFANRTGINTESLLGGNSDTKNSNTTSTIASGINDVVQTGIDASNKNQTGDKTKDNLKTFGAISNKIGSMTGPYGQVANAAVQGFIGGATNYDKGKAETEINTMKETERQANNISQQYTAGQNQLNTLKRTGTVYGQKKLKTGKGWKNVLGATASGAMAGAAIGGPWGALIGGAIGAAGAGIGSIFGRKKRDKLAEQMKNAKRSEDYAVDYYNSKQAEQLQSANDNAAKVEADRNRQSILNLVAYGGKLKRNCLIGKRNKLC